MWKTTLACFGGRVSEHEETLKDKQPKLESYVYRDELDKKPSPRKAVKKRVHFANSEPLVLGEEEERGGKDLAKGSYNDSSEEEKEVIRVKVRMTKEEAARMLSKCKEGGLLELKDVASELVAIPVNRITIVSPEHL